MRPKTFLMEVSIQVDEDEVDTAEKAGQKEKEIKDAIESLDPGIGIFIVENVLGGPE